MRKFIYLSCWIEHIIILMIILGWLPIAPYFTKINESVTGNSWDIAFYIFALPPMFLTGYNYFLVNRHKEYWLNILILVFGPIFNIVFLWKVLQSRWI